MQNSSNRTWRRNNSSSNNRSNNNASSNRCTKGPKYGLKNFKNLTLSCFFVNVSDCRKGKREGLTVHPTFAHRTFLSDPPRKEGKEKNEDGEKVSLLFRASLSSSLLLHAFPSLLPSFPAWREEIEREREKAGWHGEKEGLLLVKAGKEGEEGGTKVAAQAAEVQRGERKHEKPAA